MMMCSDEKFSRDESFLVMKSAVAVKSQRRAQCNLLCLQISLTLASC